MRRRLQSILLLTSVTVAVACDQNRQTSPSQPRSPGSSSGVEKLKQDAKDAVTSSKAFLIQQKEQFEKKLGDKMTDFEKRLSELKSKSVRAGDRAKSEWNNTLTQLQEKKQVAADKFKQLKDSTADKWQALKSGAEAAFADVEKAFKDAVGGSAEDDKSARK